VSAGRMGLGESLRAIRWVARREVGAGFDSGIAYVSAVAFTLLSSSIFMNEFFLGGTVDMTPFFDLLPLLLAFFLPALSMRLWAEEKKQRTVELLLTLPLHPLQAVVGKFLAALAIYALFLLGSLPIPIMLAALGEPDLGRIASGYLGLLGLGAFFLAFGGLLSALTKDQIVAFVASTLVGFGFVLTGDERVVSILDGLAPALELGSRLQASLSVMPPYGRFVRGVVELSSTLYFLLGTVFFLWTTGLVLERDRG